MNEAHMVTFEGAPIIAQLPVSDPSLAVTRLLFATMLKEVTSTRAHTREEARRRLTDTLYVAALAAKLGYSVYIDTEGFVHIFLPWTTNAEGHVKLPYGLSGHQYFGACSPERSRATALTFFEALTPGLDVEAK